MCVEDRERERVSDEHGIGHHPEGGIALAECRVTSPEGKVTSPEGKVTSPEGGVTLPEWQVSVVLTQASKVNSRVSPPCASSPPASYLEAIQPLDAQNASTQTRSRQSVEVS